jgi:hypothetical protein
VSGQDTTPAQVKCGFTIQFEDLMSMDLPTKQSMFFQLDVALSFETAAKSGNWAVVLSNFKQNVKC